MRSHVTTCFGADIFATNIFTDDIVVTDIFVADISVADSFVVVILFVVDAFCVDVLFVGTVAGPNLSIGRVTAALLAGRGCLRDPIFGLHLGEKGLLCSFELGEKRRQVFELAGRVNLKDVAQFPVYPFD